MAVRITREGHTDFAFTDPSAVRPGLAIASTDAPGAYSVRAVLYRCPNRCPTRVEPVTAPGLPVAHCTTRFRWDGSASAEVTTRLLPTGRCRLVRAVR